MDSIDWDRLSTLDRAAIWAPQPGPQLEAVLSNADQLLFGGAAGGGKTSLGIGLALTAYKRTLFVRREGLQLGPVVDEIAAIVGSRDGYNGADHVWRMAGGRQIQFGGCPTSAMKSGFRGTPGTCSFWTRPRTSSSSKPGFFSGGLRSTEPAQRCRTLICSNPPTSAEGEWLVRWFRPWPEASPPR